MVGGGVRHVDGQMGEDSGHFARCLVYRIIILGFSEIVGAGLDSFQARQFDVPSWRGANGDGFQLFGDCLAISIVFHTGLDSRMNLGSIRCAIHVDGQIDGSRARNDGRIILCPIDVTPACQRLVFSTFDILISYLVSVSCGCVHPKHFLGGELSHACIECHGEFEFDSGVLVVIFTVL